MNGNRGKKKLIILSECYKIKLPSGLESQSMGIIREKKNIKANKIKNKFRSLLT